MPQNYNYKIRIVEKNRLKGCGISGKRKKPCSPKRTEPEKQDPCGKKNPVVEQKIKNFKKNGFSAHSTEAQTVLFAPFSQKRRIDALQNHYSEKGQECQAKIYFSRKSEKIREKFVRSA